tara:strand:- start:176 stop:574 length:399 start_codon:yes stop_codon:yes gene_type:complete
MYYSCESRAPFLFNRIVDLSLKIPSRYLFKNFTTKSILREASSKCMPTSIANDNNKIGFYGNIQEIINPVKERIFDCIKDSSFLSDEIKLDEFYKILKEDNLNNVLSKSIFVIFQTAILEDSIKKIEIENTI